MIIRLAAAILLLAVLAPAGAAAADLAADARYAALGPECAPTRPYQFIDPAPADLLIGPGHTYDRLAVIPPCTSLNVILCEYRTAWCRVRYGRYDGWIFVEYLRPTAVRYPLGH